MLGSSYNHDKDVFPDKVDVVLQDETIGIDTWRRLRNTRDIKPEKDAISAAAAAAFGSSVVPTSPGMVPPSTDGKPKTGLYNEVIIIFFVSENGVIIFISVSSCTYWWNY